MAEWVPINEAARRAKLHLTTIWRWTRRRRPDGTPLLASRDRGPDSRYDRSVVLVAWEQLQTVLADPRLRPRPTGRPRRRGRPRRCRARGCGKPVLTTKGGAKGWCAAHYQSARRARLRRENQKQ